MQTSALDARTETELMKNINSILTDKARTSIFIAHRLRTVVEADLIIVMNNGVVVEQGTHQQLLERGGLYYDMWLEQAMDAFSGEDESSVAEEEGADPEDEKVTTRAV